MAWQTASNDITFSKLSFLSLVAGTSSGQISVASFKGAEQRVLMLFVYTHEQNYIMIGMLNYL